MKRRGPGRRAPPPAFKRETARCPSLGAPSADRATQCAARAVLSVPLTPRGARAALAAAAHRATRRERRPRRPAALTGERGDAGVCMCVCVGVYVYVCRGRETTPASRSVRDIPSCAQAEAPRSLGEPSRTIAGSFVPKGLYELHHEGPGCCCMGLHLGGVMVMLLYEIMLYKIILWLLHGFYGCYGCSYSCCISQERGCVMAAMPARRE